MSFGNAPAQISLQFSVDRHDIGPLENATRQL